MLDKNLTVWQRLNQRLVALGFQGEELLGMTNSLHPYVVAERHDAVQQTNARLVRQPASNFYRGDNG